MSGESTVRDALIAETLGDIGKLHDRVGVLNHTLEKQTLAFEQQTLKFIDLLQNSASAHLDQSNQGASAAEIKEIIEGFKVHLVSAIGKGNDRLFQAVSQPASLSNASAPLGEKGKDHFEMFSTVHEQWTNDVRDVGEKMDSAQSRTEELLKQASLLLAKATAVTPGQALPPAPINSQASTKTNANAVLIPVIAAVVVTSALFLGAYYGFGIAKAADLGGALIRDWQKLDLTTRTKITSTLNAR